MAELDFPSGDNTSAEARLEREAAQWFFLRDGGFTAAQRTAFDAWLRDERHRAVFDEIERTWGRLADAPIAVATVPERRGLARWRRQALGMTAAAAVALAALGIWRSAPVSAEYADVAATDVGALRRMALPDGSTITLNTNSSVAIEFSAAARRVRLDRGEAHFEVAKNSARPFTVHANGVEVKAVGTAFNVRLRPAEVEVVVTEGRVRVADVIGGGSLVAGSAPAESRDAALLSAGKRVIIPLRENAAIAPAVPATLTPVEVDRVLAWQKRRLDYADARLDEIVADFNRYNRHQLVIADARLAERRFGGTFGVEDHASLVRLLETTFGVVVERRASETVLRLP